ncbi:MAG: cardiolipin synthase B, partial [Sphingobium sp.]|nr:cardiolipin synthase B [Sphingobium sp.]
MVAGNQLRVIEHGPDLLSALITLIDEARVSLKLYYYIFAADESGGKVLDALLAARQRGVAVTLIIDAFGSANTPDVTFDALRRAGGRFAWFGMRRSTRYLIRAIRN